MTVAVESGIRTVRFIPRPGERILSVNLAMVDFEEFGAIAKSMGFKPEVIHLAYSGGAVEVHGLLWQGAQADAPPDLEDKYDELAEHLNPDAIYYALGLPPGHHRSRGGDRP